MSDTPFNANHQPSVTLGLPAEPNYFFNSSANIVPSFNNGPRTYTDGGFVAHPLQLTGSIMAGSTPRINKEQPAGATASAPGGEMTMLAFPQPYTIGGKRPGWF